MTKTYAQLMSQIASLTSEAEKLKRKEIDGVITRIKEAISTYDLTADDLGFSGARGVAGKRGPRKTGGRAGGKPPQAVRFRDSSGNTWVGRGPRPQWLRDALAAGKTLKDFAA